MSKKSKIFVIDTSVILYDHNAIYNFEEHDVAIPITVLEELDDFKKGNDTINFEAREFIRTVDKLAQENTLTDWIKINGNDGKFKVIMTTENPTIDATKIFQDRKADHRILNAAISLQNEYPNRTVVLVSKDVNLRLKAKSLNLKAEDYLTGKIENVDNLFTGKLELDNVDDSIITDLYQNGYCSPEKLNMTFESNLYLVLKNEKSSVLAFYNKSLNRLERIDKKTCYKITPRNSEQTFAIHALLNDDVKLVTLQGKAGTGKTLLALAAALQQQKTYRQIYLARPIVPLSKKDLGALPGNVQEKIEPYILPLFDNLKFIQSQYKESDKEYKFITDCVKEEKLIITPLAYIRGRSISNTLFIIDECLTKNNLIWTSDGKSLPIQNLKNDDIVISNNMEINQQGNNIISNFFERQTNEIMEIKTSKGTFECTPTHQWWVYDNGVELKKKLAKDITKNDLMLISEKMPHYIKNELSIEDSKLLALILTDGHIEKNTKRIKIEMSKDKIWLEKTFNDITKNFETVILENKKRKTIICCIKNPTTIHNYVDKYNLIVGKKSNNIIVPDQIWNAPLESVKNFISVCFDAEGDVNYNTKKNNLVISFSTTSKVFAYQLSSLLLKFGIQSHIYNYDKKNKKHATSYRVSIINYYAKNFLENIGFTMERKQNIYNIIKNINYENPTIYPLKIGADIKKQSTSIKILTESLGRIRFDDNKSYNHTTFIKMKEYANNNNIKLDYYYPCCRINSIEYITLNESTSVYDFTVNNDHTFYVNGVISSNCQNLTPHEVKTIITRAGEGTKIIFTGDIHQIDTPYLDTQSNGLSHIIDRMNKQSIYSHITLVKGERSELADLANELL
jgi:PhoH-like ATPase